MRSDPVLATYLHQLQETDVVKEKQTKEKASTRATRVEDMDTDDSGSGMGRVQQVDLDDLSFQQGSHLMANKRCHLPDGSFRKQKKGRLCDVLKQILERTLLLDIVEGCCFKHYR